MNHLFNAKTLKLIFKILVLIAIAKTISLIAFILLPKSGVEISGSDKNFINFNAFSQTVPFASAARTTASSSIQGATQISNIKLLAVYKETNKAVGFVIIMDGAKSQVLKLGEAYKQYKLEEIKPDGIFLSENGKQLWVGFAKSTLEVASSLIPVAENAPEAMIGIQKQPFRGMMNRTMPSVEEEIQTSIKKSDIEELLNNPDAAFKNIGFKEVMKDGKIDGFRILSINRNSPLSKLGLRAGDVIQSFNGVRLDNYSSVLEIYNKASTLSRVKVEITRNNEPKEFEYEIF